MNKRTMGSILLAALSLVSTMAEAQNQQATRIHAIGYSVTYNAICGTSELFFTGPHGEECAVYREYGGGIAEVWWSEIGRPAGIKWRMFQAGIEFNGMPSVIYWQIGFLRQSTPSLSPTELDWLFEVADEIRARAPGATIYVSGMSAYSPFVCERLNKKAIEKSWNAAGVLWGSSPDILMGPVLPSITPDQTAGSGDPCHLGPLGQAEHGALLHEFFDELLEQ